MAHPTQEDLERAERLVSAAQWLRHEGDFAGALELLDAAVALDPQRNSDSQLVALRRALAESTGSNPSVRTVTYDEDAIEDIAPRETEPKDERSSEQILASLESISPIDALSLLGPEPKRFDERDFENLVPKIAPLVTTSAESASESRKVTRDAPKPARTSTPLPQPAVAASPRLTPRELPVARTLTPESMPLVATSDESPSRRFRAAEPPAPPLEAFLPEAFSTEWTETPGTDDKRPGKQRRSLWGGAGKRERATPRAAVEEIRSLPEQSATAWVASGFAREDAPLGGPAGQTPTGERRRGKARNVASKKAAPPTLKSSYEFELEWDPAPAAFPTEAVSARSNASTSSTAQAIPSVAPLHRGQGMSAVDTSSSLEELLFARSDAADTLKVKQAAPALGAIGETAPTVSGWDAPVEPITLRIDVSREQAAVKAKLPEGRIPTPAPMPAVQARTQTPAPIPRVATPSPMPAVQARIPTPAPMARIPTPAPLPAVAAPAVAAEVKLPKLSADVDAKAPYRVTFVEGPLKGRNLGLANGVPFVLGEAGTSAVLSVLAGELVVRDDGTPHGVYLSLKGEERIDSGTRILAGRREFLYERRGGEGDDALFLLHEIDSKGRVERTNGIIDEVFTVGRADCTLSLPSEESLAETHFEITPGPWAAFLADQSGGKGTFIRLEQGSPWPVEIGAHIRSGPHLLRVEEGSAA